MSEQVGEAGEREGPVITLRWGKDDAEHPFNWPLRRKWRVLPLTFLFNGITIANASSYAAAGPVARLELGVSLTVWLLGLTAYNLSLGFTPLALAPLTEAKGRRWTCIVALFLFTLMYVPQALTTHFVGIAVSRIVQGAAASMGNTMSSAVIADMFSKHDRLTPMAVSVWVVLTCHALGPLFSTWIAHSSTLGWRWVFWLQAIVALVLLCLMVSLLPETRAQALLERRARILRTQERVRYVVEQGPTMSKRAYLISVERIFRPLFFFVTEPIVALLSLWIGFLWGVLFLALEGVPTTMERAYGWSVEDRTSFVSVFAIGALCGLLCSPFWSRRYAAQAQRQGDKLAPEVRLHACMPASFLTTIGLFVFAWTARMSISAVVPAIGLTFLAWGTYEIYLGTLTYIVDAYEVYASSGIACQALLRQLFAGTFGLFAEQMYTQLRPSVATSILGAIAAMLGASPFLLISFGKSIRRRSKMAVQLSVGSPL